MCIRHDHVWVSRGPKWEKQPTACRRCWQCRSGKVNDYVGRCLAEASTSEWTVTLTLTYRPPDNSTEDALAHKRLTPSHFQRSIRALRDAHLEEKYRYIVAGEYGKKTGRAHFHAVIFGSGPPLDIPHKKTFQWKHWNHGHAFADHGSDERALRYVIKYLLDPDKDGGRSWFSISKDPALGAAFFRQKADELISLGVLPSSFRYLPPGAQPDRHYYITGASRRDYLLRIYDGLKASRPKLDTQCNEWVAKSLHKALTWRAVKRLEEAEKTLLRSGQSPEFMTQSAYRWLPEPSNLLDAEGKIPVPLGQEVPKNGQTSTPRNAINPKYSYHANGSHAFNLRAVEHRAWNSGLTKYQAEARIRFAQKHDRRGDSHPDRAAGSAGASSRNTKRSGKRPE